MANGGRTFHPFPRLPAELRLQVWEQSLDYRREVDVRVKSRGLSKKLFDVKILSRTPTPTILHTCQEGRYSRLYQQAFSDIPRQTVENERSYVWVNWDCDTIKIGKTDFVWYSRGRSWASIQYLHFSTYSLLNWDVEALKRCVSLKRVVVICKSGRYSWRRAFPGCPTSCNIELTAGVGPDGIQNLDGDEDTLVDKACDDRHEEWSVEITPRFFRGS
ncbi:hypothetical protein B0H65DRAFT_323191 [Neurospora tetraspora]|uniref:2EXR domain-containing protein n=1 Tax=Neurospora tetraspora TaxID=94610 RepID=A0AAE0J7S3_9PEZI|nr:hypothetical protein B0H65DRAFT_323191 [Neurospora tetraspora]